MQNLEILALTQTLGTQLALHGWHFHRQVHYPRYVLLGPNGMKLRLAKYSQLLVSPCRPENSQHVRVPHDFDQRFTRRFPLDATADDVAQTILDDLLPQYEPVYQQLLIDIGRHFERTARRLELQEHLRLHLPADYPIHFAVQEDMTVRAHGQLSEEAARDLVALLSEAGECSCEER